MPLLMSRAASSGFIFSRCRIELLWPGNRLFGRHLQGTIHRRNMHELSIASSVLEAVAKEAERRPNSKIVKVGLRIGELAAVDRDALSFGWEVLTKDTEWQGLELAIESIPRRQRCTGCGHEFAAPDFMTECPKCAELMTITIAGDELDIAYLEVEEP
jgi:hydrogenase nickel incorporation protein HypA/HybF